MLKIYGICLLIISLGLQFPIFYTWPYKILTKLCCWTYDHSIICSLVLGSFLLVLGYFYDI